MYYASSSSSSSSPSKLNARHLRSSPITQLDGMFTMAQHEHTLRARKVTFSSPSSPMSPMTPTSSSWPSEQPTRPFRRLPVPPKPKPRRLPDPPLPSPSTHNSFASTSSAGKPIGVSADSANANSSYITFDNSDSDTDYDELDDLSDSTWSFVEYQGNAFPIPRPSLPPTPTGSPRNHSFPYFNRSALSGPVAPATTRAQKYSKQTLPPPSYSHILGELGMKELEPIGPSMEPAIFADDGAQGDWRQMVDDLFMAD
ncbi:hypothetical protein BC835DRAFT_269243 [Cytidiella melzeri]|nr:hypothetical protein BC835DRAFT_269243 [Cytidiella melzeri]